MVKLAKPLVIDSKDAAAYWQIGILWQVMATGVQTDNAFTFLDQIVGGEVGVGPMTHTHTQGEGLYIISGRCTFNAGGTQGLEAGPGTFVCIPGDTEHSFTVDEPYTRLLNFYLPAGFEQIIMGIGHPAETHDPPPPERLRAMLPPEWLAEKLSADYGQTNVAGTLWNSRPKAEQMITRPTPGATLLPYVIRANQIESYEGLNGTWSILASGKQTGDYCIMEVRYGQGVVFDCRVYRQTDEIFYILEGEMTFLLGNVVKQVKKNSMVYVPAGTIYSARVDSKEALCLDLHTKAGFDELIKASCSSGEGQQGINQSILDIRMKQIGLEHVAVQNPLAS